MQIKLTKAWWKKHIILCFKKLVDIFLCSKVIKNVIKSQTCASGRKQIFVFLGTLSLLPVLKERISFQQTLFAAEGVQFKAWPLTCLCKGVKRWRISSQDDANHPAAILNMLVTLSYKKASFSFSLFLINKPPDSIHVTFSHAAHWAHVFRFIFIKTGIADSRL